MLLCPVLSTCPLSSVFMYLHAVMCSTTESQLAQQYLYSCAFQSLLQKFAAMVPEVAEDDKVGEAKQNCSICGETKYITALEHTGVQQHENSNWESNSSRALSEKHWFRCVQPSCFYRRELNLKSFAGGMGDFQCQSSRNAQNNLHRVRGAVGFSQAAGLRTLCRRVCRVRY